MSNSTPAESPEQERIKVSWGKYGQALKKRFALSPQPALPDGAECLLLQNPQEQLLDLAAELKASGSFVTLSLLNAVEYKEALQLIYQLMRLRGSFELLYLKANLPKDALTIPSLTPLWHSADWFEREIYDMHGVVFQGHPNLKRILNPADWEGFPLRKDYIPPLDALNGPITAVRGSAMDKLRHSKRQDIEVITDQSPKSSG